MAMVNSPMPCSVSAVSTGMTPRQMGWAGVGVSVGGASVGGLSLVDGLYLVGGLSLVGGCF